MVLSLLLFYFVFIPLEGHKTILVLYGKTGDITVLVEGLMMARDYFTCSNNVVLPMRFWFENNGNFLSWRALPGITLTLFNMLFKLPLARGSQNFVAAALKMKRLGANGLAHTEPKKHECASTVLVRVQTRMPLFVARAAFVARHTVSLPKTTNHFTAINLLPQTYCQHDLCGRL